MASADGRTRITLSVKNLELLDKVDEDRDLADRSPFICDILERYYGVGRHEGKIPLKEFNEQAGKGKGK